MSELTERLEEKEENVLDRRKLSQSSIEHLAEDIQQGNVREALDDVFTILTGEQVSEHHPSRDVEGVIGISDGLLKDNQSLMVQVRLDDLTQSIAVSDGEVSTYTFRSMEGGDYGVELDPIEVVEYRDDYSRTRYNIASVDLDGPTQVTVDTESSEYGSIVGIGKSTVNSLAIGDKIQESDR
jgi:hypothetical protein